GLPRAHPPRWAAVRGAGGPAPPRRGRARAGGWGRAHRAPARRRSRRRDPPRRSADAGRPRRDRAVRTGLSQVRIVHGLGTGALRRAVHELLASSPYCARFRDAAPEAGGAAVTIAELV